MGARRGEEHLQRECYIAYSVFARKRLPVAVLHFQIPDRRSGKASGTKEFHALLIAMLPDHKNLLMSFKTLKTDRN